MTSKPLINNIISDDNLEKVELIPGKYIDLRKFIPKSNITENINTNMNVENPPFSFNPYEVKNKTIKMNEINDALRLINKLLSTKNPGEANNLSYNVYFKDMADISNGILLLQQNLNARDQKILKLVHALGGSTIKQDILKLLNASI